MLSDLWPLMEGARQYQKLDMVRKRQASVSQKLGSWSQVGRPSKAWSRFDRAEKATALWLSSHVTAVSATCTWWRTSRHLITIATSR